MKDTFTLASAQHQGAQPGTPMGLAEGSRRHYSLATLRSMIATWRERIRFRKELAQKAKANPHLIEDMGLKRWQVEAEIDELGHQIADRRVRGDVELDAGDVESEGERGLLLLDDVGEVLERHPADDPGAGRGEPEALGRGQLRGRRHAGGLSNARASDFGQSLYRELFDTDLSRLVRWLQGLF